YALCVPYPGTRRAVYLLGTLPDRTGVRPLVPLHGGGGLRARWHRGEGDRAPHPGGAPGVPDPRRGSRLSRWHGERPGQGVLSSVSRDAAAGAALPPPRHPRPRPPEPPPPAL